MVTMHCGHSARTAAYPAWKYFARVSFCTCVAQGFRSFTDCAVIRLLCMFSLAE